MKINIGNLSSKITANDLRTMFGAYGMVESTSVVRDEAPGDNRWTGYVLMPSRPEAAAAIKALQGRNLKGRELEVKEAPPRALQKPRRGRHRSDAGTSHV